MNLVIDIGNTDIKLGVFKKAILQKKITGKKENLPGYLEELTELFPGIANVLVASVGEPEENLLDILSDRFSFLMVLDSTVKLPFLNKYASPKTLGVDRIALASAASRQFPGQNVLIIDAGSCITYDILTEKNEYLGGAISPGIEMRYKALHNYTAKLPLLNKESPDYLVGDSTSASIHSGIVNGIRFEIEGFIAGCKNKFPNLAVILTGGNAPFLRDKLKNDIFANSDFLLEGLNHILECNA